MQLLNKICNMLVWVFVVDITLKVMSFVLSLAFILTNFDNCLTNFNLKIRYANITLQKCSHLKWKT